MSGRHRYVATRAMRRRQVRREEAAATWRALVAHSARGLAEAQMTSRGEAVAILPPIPAGRDAQAAAGDGQPLRDCDPEWTAAHESAVERTQPIPRLAMALWDDAPSSTGQYFNATAQAWRARPATRPVVTVHPYRDPANPNN